MNTNTVIPQTARLMADAGFPQPAPAPGQWWGNGEKLIFVFRKWQEGYYEYFTIIEHLETDQPGVNRYFDAEDFPDLVYLPTAADILREMQGHKNYTYSIRFDGKMWLVERTFTPVLGPAALASWHESEHEAAAIAWLQLNKK